jgi:hypothetical protein
MTNTIWRIQDVAIPIVRARVNEQWHEPVKVGSWVEDIDYRMFPMVNIRRLGGSRHERRPHELYSGVIEMTAYGKQDYPDTENLYETALLALYDAVRDQTQTEHGYLHSIKETMGATQFGSLFQSSWRVQGLIRLGVRPPRN